MQQDKTISNFTENLKQYLHNNIKNRVFTSPSLLKGQNYTVYRGLNSYSNKSEDKSDSEMVKYETKKKKFHSNKFKDQKLLGKLMIPISSLLHERSNFKYQLKLQRKQNMNLSTTVSSKQKYEDYFRNFEGLQRILKSQYKNNRLKTSQVTEYKLQQSKSPQSKKLQIMEKQPIQNINQEHWRKIEKQSKRVKNQTQIVLRLVKKRQPEQIEKALQRIKKQNDKFFRPKYLRGQRSQQKQLLSMKQINIHASDNSRQKSLSKNQGILMKIMKANLSGKKIEKLQKNDTKPAQSSSLRKKQKINRANSRRKSQYVRRSQVIDLQITGWNDRPFQQLDNY